MFKKIASCTYEAGPGYYVEKMQDGTWTAYQPVDDADRYLWRWSSAKHQTRQSAYRAVGYQRRLNKFFGTKR